MKKHPGFSFVRPGYFFDETRVFHMRTPGYFFQKTRVFFCPDFSPFFCSYTSPLKTCSGETWKKLCMSLQ